MFLVGLAFVGLLSSPNGLREWRRIQLPVADLQWTDEWSSRKLDWIDVGVVNTLAESVGGPSEVGWWYAHGNAIEVLTGITNHLGLTVSEGAANSSSLLRIACEPISRERPKLIITIADYLPLLDSCNGVAGNQIIAQTNKPLVLVSLKYNE